MRQLQRQPSSYFSFSRHSSQSTDSSAAVSPNTSVQCSRPILAQAPRVRQLSAPRTDSDYTTRHPRVKVQTIEEYAAHNASTRALAETQSRSQANRWSADIRRSKHSGAASAPSPARSSPASSITRQANRMTGPDTRKELVMEPPFKSRPGHTWSRTCSGSVWYKRLKGSSASSRPTDSSGRSQAYSVPKRLITPLTPPPPPSLARVPPDRHQVKVERPFTELRPDMSSTSRRPPLHPTTASGSRRSSINPLRLFSAPLQLLRRFSAPKRKLLPETEGEKSPTVVLSGIEMPGHISLLKRNKTVEALRQVTSILHENTLLSGACSPVSVLEPLNARHISDKSSSPKDRANHKKHRLKATKGLNLPGTTFGNESPSNRSERVYSYTTSQWELRMGGQPNNTPDEQATYQIKRSPSAETEEFLKVDISIRGGTSYLPSEARRIHTPRLPQEGLDGKRRGFFFDYTAPRSDASPGTSLTSPAKPGLPVEHGSKHRRVSSKASTVHKRTFSFQVNKLGKKETRAKTCDWYDAKLAELETTDEEEDHSERSWYPGVGRGRSETMRSGRSLQEIKQRKEEDMLDFSIPEHLPSSPLCPRNERYWRIVQGRGSQFRGCWMHGVRLWGKE